MQNSSSRLVTIAGLCALASACASPPTDNSGVSTELAKINTTMVRMESSLAAQFAESCDSSIQDLNEKIEELKASKQTTRIVERCTETKKSKALADGKLMMGEVEKVTLVKEDLTFNARIDTGADTSSIGVFNATRFERDGDKWVRFNISEKKDAEVYEYPISGTVRIKQSGMATEDRVEIRMDIEIGGKKYRKQIFNLADRSNLDYRLLIGRSFLRDIAVVDVSRKRLLKGG